MPFDPENPNSNDVKSSDDFAELCECVKKGLIDTLTPELIPTAEPVEGEKVPKIKNRRIMDTTPETWAGKLESDRHKVGGKDKIHTYMVGYAGINSVDGGITARKGYQLRFVVDSYYENDIGSDADNAEKRHAREVHKISYAVFASPLLGIPGIVDRVIEFKERRGFAKMGTAMTRESLAEVVVQIRPVPLVKPVVP